MFICDNIQHLSKKVPIIYLSPWCYKSLFFFHTQPQYLELLLHHLAQVSLLTLLRFFSYYFNPRHRANCITCWPQCRMKMWTLVQNSENSLLLSLFLSSPVMAFSYLVQNDVLPLNQRYWQGELMQRANSLEKSLMLGKIEGRRRRG